jgi:hypothetical protein
MKKQKEKMNKDKKTTLNFIINPLKKSLNILKILGKNDKGTFRLTYGKW